MPVGSFQWENGVWRPTDGIPPGDRGFRHGISVFETVKIHRGQLILLSEHLEKIRHAAASLGFRKPPNLEDFLTIPSLPDFGTARLYITAGDGSFRDPFDQGRIFLLVEEAPALPASSPTSLIISADPHQPPWPGWKTGNYWPNIAAHRSAGEQHADEIVLVNPANHVVSASLANLFCVIDGLLFTPRVSSGARAGVIRDWVIAREDVIVSDFHPEQLREASEIFLSNSGYGIAPIALLEGRTLASQLLGKKLRGEYLAWLEHA